MLLSAVIPPLLGIHLQNIYPPSQALLSLNNPYCVVGS